MNYSFDFEFSLEAFNKLPLGSLPLLPTQDADDTIYFPAFGIAMTAFQDWIKSDYSTLTPYVDGTRVVQPLIEMDNITILLQQNAKALYQGYFKQLPEGMTSMIFFLCSVLQSTTPNPGKIPEMQPYNSNYFVIFYYY